MAIEGSTTSTATWRRWVKQQIDSLSGGGSALEVEDNGSPLTADATKLNFVGFTVTEPVADQITVTTPVITHPTVSVEDGGTPLTTAVTTLNFVGFDVTEPTADEITITYAGPVTDGISPGYNYSQYSTTALTVDLVDVENLFRIGRRLKIGSSGTYVYGVVNYVDYNSTATNDTYVALTMEASATVPSTIDELYLVSDDANWSPIAEDPFSGGAIRGIATGVLSSVQWWIIVGDGGKLYYSTNKGLNWTVGSSGTSETLYTICYDATNAKFWIGGSFESGGDCYLAYSTNGTTWTEVSAIDNNGGLTHAVGDYISNIRWHRNGSYMVGAVWDNSVGSFYYSATNDQWATEVAKTSASVGLIGADNAPSSYHAKWIYSGGADQDDILEYDSFGDPSPLNAYLGNGETVEALSLFSCPNAPDVVENWAFVGTGTGRLVTLKTNGWTAYVDDLTFSNAIRGFAHAANTQRSICVGDSAVIGYIDDADLGTIDSWTSVSNGFSPTSNVLCAAYNETDMMFVACADNGQICRSTNGIS